MYRALSKHPLALRWFHWLNFPLLALMVWSGFLILWANDVYATQLYQLGHRLTHGGQEDLNPPLWLRVSTERFGYRLAEGQAWHFALAWAFSLNGLAYVVFLAVSGQWRHLAPRRESVREAVKVAIKDLAFWRRIEPAPEGFKYNDAQRLAYCGVIVLGALMVWTGVAIYKPAQLAWMAVPFGSYQGARLVHFIVTWLLVAFFGVHVLQVLRAGWNNFRAMVVGWETTVIAPRDVPVEDEASVEESEE